MLHFGLEQLLAFTAVAESGSFSQAARSLGKNRTTLHQHVTNLEIDFNLTLFDRVGKRLYLTPEGQKLLAQAKHTLYQAQYLQNCADSLAEQEESTLTVYHDGMLPLDYMATADRWVRDAFPQINLNWLHRSRDAIYRSLQDGSADLGLALSYNNTLPDHGIDFFNLGGLNLKIYVSNTSPLISRQPCSVKDFTSHRRLLLEGYEGTSLQSRSELSSKDTLISTPDALLRLLTQGGWSVVPALLVEGSEYCNQLTALSVDFKDSPAYIDYVLFSNKLTTSGPALSLLIESIKAQFQTHCPSVRSS